MATESDLRDLLRGPDPKGGGAIDVDAVLTRARRRRRPRVVAAQALGSVALVGGLFTAVVVATPPGGPISGTVAEDAGLDEAAAPYADGSATGLAVGASGLAYCGAPLPDVAPAANGLVLELAPVDAPSSDARIPVAATLRNTGDERVTGTTGVTPIVAFTRDGVVLWHDRGPWEAIGVAVDLAPGETMTFEAAFEPVACTPDDEVEGFARVIPTAGPGSYAVNAALDFFPDDGTGGPIVVTGPPAPVMLR